MISNNILTVVRKTRPCPVLKVKVKDLDPKRCSFKFKQLELDPETEVYIKCDEEGNIIYRSGSKQFYSILSIEHHPIYND